MKRLFNKVKNFYEKRRINKEKYGSKRPMFAIFSKEKKKKIVEANRNYKLSLIAYHNMISIIEENKNKLSVNEKAIEICFDSIKNIGDNQFDNQNITKLLEEQRDLIKILNEAQKELAGPIKEKLEECCFINRVKMIKDDCFNLWNIKDEEIVFELQTSMMSKDEDKQETNSSVLPDEVKKKYDDILDDSSFETDERNNLVAKQMNDNDKAALSDLQSIYIDGSLVKEQNIISFDGRINTDKFKKMVMKFQGKNNTLGNYFGITGIMYDGEGDINQKIGNNLNGISEEALTKSLGNDNNILFLGLEDQYDECKTEIRGALEDYYRRREELDTKYNIFEYKEIKEGLTSSYNSELSNLEEKYWIVDYRNEYKSLEENYSAYPRFLSILKETLKEKYENHYHKDLEEFNQKELKLNEQFEMQINTLNESYSIPQYIEEKEVLDQDLARYKTQLEEVYGTETLQKAWCEVNNEINENKETGLQYSLKKIA